LVRMDWFIPYVSGMQTGKINTRPFMVQLENIKTMFF
jgi:hypothetical protein